MTKNQAKAACDEAIESNSFTKGVNMGRPSEMITRAWRSDRYDNAEQRRDAEAEKLEKDGWIVEPYSAEISGRDGFTTYGFEGRPVDVPQ